MSVVVAWLLKHWRTIVIAIAVGGLVWLWESRSVLSERCARLQSELQIRIEQNAADRAACAEIAKQLTEQQKAVDDWAQALGDERAEHEQRMSEAVRHNESVRQDLVEANAQVLDAIRRAETCEDQVKALSHSIGEVVNGNR